MTSASKHSMTRRGFSINTLLVLSFVVVSLLPISILGFKIYDAAWDNAWREVREKHQSLAKNLATPLLNYVDDRHIALSLLADQLAQLDDPNNPRQVSALLERGRQDLNRFHAMFLLDREQRVLNHAAPYEVAKGSRFALGEDDFFTAALARNTISLSPVLLNPYSGKTTLLIAQAVNPDAAGRPRQLLVGELDKAFIETLRASISFGEQGHSAMVDALGRVLAHPNPDWMNDYVKDISHLSVIQLMMQGKTGVTEFYSPFKKQDMVAGYTTVPKYGWGIMVPQPKPEVEAQVARVLRAELVWALAGLALALIIGLSLARWITRPINQLVKAGRELQEKNYHAHLPEAHSFAPREIQQLDMAFGGAVKNLINSRQELNALNQSLQHRVEAATLELREANVKLEELTKLDHLTQLSNRRHFEDTIIQLASRRRGDSQCICLLLLDIDHFKAINDEHGHPAGDAVLVQIGKILQGSLRHTDIAARYAGDEFVVLLRTDLDAGRLHATQICQAIDEHRFVYNGKDLHTTVSIGLVCCEINAENCDIEKMLHRVDEALYEAKRHGRNRVIETSLEVVS